MRAAQVILLVFVMVAAQSTVANASSLQAEEDSPIEAPFGNGDIGDDQVDPVRDPEGSPGVDPTAGGVLVGTTVTNDIVDTTIGRSVPGAPALPGTTTPSIPAGPAVDSGEVINQTQSGLTAEPVPALCGEWVTLYPTIIDSNGNVQVVPTLRCVWKPVACGSERVDEAATGERAGGQGFGAFAEWVNVFTSLASIDLGAIGFDPPPTTVTVGEITVADARGPNFGAEDTLDFNYCRRQFGTSPGPWPLILVDPFGPSFTVGTPMRDNFDIDSVRNDLRDVLEQHMLLQLPDMRATPPLDHHRRLFVRFPSWFWLHDLVDHYATFGESELATIRITQRAVFTHVTWTFGPHTWDCTVDQMLEYRAGLHPESNKPECNRTFTKVETHELTATAHYFVQERIQIRAAASDPWPNTAWSPHANAYTAVPNSVGRITIGEIHSLVIPTN